jgi:hypothetical protein
MRWVLLALLAACGTDVDDRSLNAQYVTEAILGPSCGTAECHSTFAEQYGYVFDTLAGMRNTVVGQGLVVIDSSTFDPIDPDSSVLIVWMSSNDPLNRGIGRMPLDGVMPFEDISLLKEWIRGVPSIRTGTTCQVNSDCTTAGDTCHIPLGSTSGQCVVYENPARGAQCDPRTRKQGGFTNGQACINNNLYACNSDWNAGDFIQQCPNGCVQGQCL